MENNLPTTTLEDLLKQNPQSETVRGAILLRDRLSQIPYWRNRAGQDGTGLWLGLSSSRANLHF